MAKKPPASTLQWCQKEIGPILEGFTLLVKSQQGFEGREFTKNFARNATQKFNDIKEQGPMAAASSFASQMPSPEVPNVVREALGRSKTVAAGIQTFASLAAQGKYPGNAGYTINEKGEKVYAATSQQEQFMSPEAVAKNITILAEFLMNTAQSTSQNIWNPMQFGDRSMAEKNKVRQKVASTSAEDESGVQQMPLPNTGLTKEEAEYLVRTSEEIGDKGARQLIYGQSPTVLYRPTIPKDYDLNISEEDIVKPIESGRESSVPASRIARLYNFGNLAIKMAGGAAAEVTRRSLKMSDEGTNPFLSKANADRIVRTLCRVRGAALKIGQMLSIQDSSMVPQPVLEIFERVRQSADFMPTEQVYNQMKESFGSDWRERHFAEFDARPFAAASIGQVHKGVLKDGRKVAIKVQYPGVAKGIDSDIDNLISIMSLGGIFPKGMFLEPFIKVARRELKMECDYEREARAMRKFRELLKDSKDFYVPEVIDSLSSHNVLTCEFCVGKPLDKCVEELQAVRDYISTKFIQLCLSEIFVWRFMQTDPNWSNFFFGKNPRTGDPCIVLLDFGATRSYSKKFVDQYMKIIKAAYDGDKEKIIHYSREIGFLTGYESELMEKAHLESVMIMGETLASDKPYDFAKTDMTTRIQQLVPVMLEHRLKAPPEEIYSLHRKLSGCYLLAAKLKATVSCGGMFSQIYSQYVFGEDGKDIEIDEVHNATTNDDSGHAHQGVIHS
ncbi:hypothetical protein WR25_19806 [Diploscapter pachys]|uniref:ABC1 atypical kinase-like domain-containing protein n=1 Tax=Diploscapter pachys TaxID=2018661 RepID=A0A2A2LAP3_9BILA|nr:hypothetical protein WR25_19806 [Diploscapter pachys]